MGKRPQKKLEPMIDENMYVGCFDYNNEYGALVMAINKEWLKRIKENKN